MTVDPVRPADVVEHNGQKFYFCSRGCAAKFRRDPEQYLKPRELVQIGGAAAPQRSQSIPHSPTPSPQSPTQYTCPMHPEIAAGQARLLPDLRHGAGTVGADRGRRNQS